MRIYAVAALTLICSLPSVAQKSGDIRRLDKSLLPIDEAEVVARRTFEAAHVTGAQIAILNKGKLVWSYAYGLRHKSPDQPMTPDTNTWAASITKSVFATYVMSLVERGEFDLDTPVAKQLPQPLDTYEPYKVIATELVKDPRWAAVTPRMLLSHSSGLANFAFLEPDRKMHLHFAPGSDFRYSGEGILLVQFLVEQQQHKPLDELMQDAFFAPFGMKQTGMIYRHDFDANLSDRFDRDGKFHSVTHRFPARASGNMATSVNDLAHFLEALLGKRILKPKTMDQMLTPQVRIHSEHQFAIAENETNGAEAKAVGLAYGLGWGLLTRTQFGPAFFKEGHGDGAQNYVICFTRSRDCMIVLTNDDNGELAFRRLFEQLLGDTVTPWEWEGYTPGYIETSRKNGN